MIAIYFWEAGSFIILIMGTLHLRGTLFSNYLHPRNKQLIDDMRNAPLKLTDKLNMWNSWIGFNATHSVGAIFVGGVNFYLAWTYSALLQNDFGLQLFTIVVLAFYVWVARKYWFRTIVILLSLSWLLFLVSCVLMATKRVYHA
jgi:hypothetical protein